MRKFTKGIEKGEKISLSSVNRVVLSTFLNGISGVIHCPYKIECLIITTYCESRKLPWIQVVSATFELGN